MLSGRRGSQECAITKPSKHIKVSFIFPAYLRNQTSYRHGTCLSCMVLNDLAYEQTSGNVPWKNCRLPKSFHNKQKCRARKSNSFGFLNKRRWNLLHISSCADTNFLLLVVEAFQLPRFQRYSLSVVYNTFWISRTTYGVAMKHSLLAAKDWRLSVHPWSNTHWPFSLLFPLNCLEITFSYDARQSTSQLVTGIDRLLCELLWYRKLKENV